MPPEKGSTLSECRHTDDDDGGGWMNGWMVVRVTWGLWLDTICYLFSFFFLFQFFFLSLSLYFFVLLSFSLS